MTPLLLLDVDGVHNALSDDLPDTSLCQRGFAVTDGMSWPIVSSLDVVARLVRWHEQEFVELARRRRPAAAHTLAGQTNARIER